MIGLRATLEMLSVPVPEYALRRKTGPSPAKAALAAFNADNRVPRTTVHRERKPNASPERIAALKAADAQRLSSATDKLFDSVFDGAAPRFLRKA